MRLEGTVVVGTGGATGIGLAAALAFARAGAAVAIMKGPFYCARAAVPHMTRRGGGAVVNLTSQAAFNGTGSSKSALGTMTKSLARALAPAIRVNAVAPGLIATGFGGFTETHWQSFAKATPAGRLATADEVAVAILSLAPAKAVTGQTLVVDGGLLTRGPVSR